MNSTPSRFSRRQQWLAAGGLTLVSVIWGTTFVAVKDAVALAPVMTFLGWRFGLGALALLPFSLRGLRRATWREWAAGGLIGVSLFAGYYLQTEGLRYTTASKAGFITGLYVPLAPLLAWPLVRQKPSRQAVVGLALATAGLGLLSLRGDLSVGRGDLLVFGCAVAFAAQVALIGYAATRMNPLTLAQIQITTVAVASILAAWVAREPFFSMPQDALTVAVYTGVLATALAIWLQNRCQGMTTVARAALVFILEPVFAALFGWLLAGETLDLRGWLGAAMILVGMAVGQMGESKVSQPNTVKEV